MAGFVEYDNRNGVIKHHVVNRADNLLAYPRKWLTQTENRQIWLHVNEHTLETPSSSRFQVFVDFVRALLVDHVRMPTFTCNAHLTSSRTKKNTGKKLNEKTTKVTAIM